MEKLMENENKCRRIIKKARRLQKRKMRSEMYRRYYLKYSSIKSTSADDFHREVSSEETSNVIPITINKKKKVTPAMPVPTYLTLFKERLLQASGETHA